MEGKKPFSREKMSWKDFVRLINNLKTNPIFSFEIVNESGHVVAVLIGERELKEGAFFDITLPDVEKFFEKHADEFKEAQALIDKIKTSKKPLKHTKKELAEAKRRMAKFRKITEKVEERVYGKTKTLTGKLFGAKRELENKLENRKRRQVPRGLFDRKENRERLEKLRDERKARWAREDQEDLDAARKAAKEKGSVPFDKLKAEFTGDKKSKKGGGDGNRKTSKA